MAVGSTNKSPRELIKYTTIGKTPDPATLIQEVTNITLDTTIILDQLILDKSIVLENIYYDLDKADIRPDAAIELDKLIAVLKDNPTIRIELSSHTDSRSMLTTLTCHKEGRNPRWIIWFPKE